MNIIEYLDTTIHTAATTIGKPDGINLLSLLFLDQVRLMLCLFMAYPLGWILNFLV